MDITNEILVGIDFGTTNTVITYFNNNKANVLLDGVFKTIPSKIGKFNDKIYCGNYIPVNCNDIIHSFKISIGENILFNFNNDLISYTHTDLMIIFFKHLYDLIIKNTKKQKSVIKDEISIIKSVITVPSNFNDKQREIIKSAFNCVNINVLRIINEPSAAALSYGLNHSSNECEKILVIDTGGGTMDFTILEKNDLFFEVVHSEGLNDLGGNNFTQLIVDDIKRTKTLDNIDNNILWNMSQKIKEKLTYLESYELTNYNLTRKKFENLSNNLIQKIELVLGKIIEEYSELNYIILVGGTSRIPILQETIKNITKKTPWIHPNLELVVAEGAGLYIGIIENKFTLNEDVVLMDVLPLSLGVELVDGSNSIIIPKNTPLPVKRSQKYTTDSPADSSIKIKIYQGERKIANKNFLIGEFIFDKVSMGGVPIIEISFKVDLNSIINVIVVDKKSGIEKSIIIKDIPKIETEDINKLIDQANSLADTDDAELARAQNIYLIRTHIENSLINLQINDLLSEESKNEILNKFKIIEDELEEMNNFKLIETLDYLLENYKLLGSVQPSDIDTDIHDDIESLLFNEKKLELKNKILLLLNTNPEWDDFLQPVLEELSYSSVSIEYIDDKLNLLNELEQDNENNKERDYKKEVNNLCLYLKSEIETGSINLGNDKNNLLSDIINNILNLFTENIEDINWEEQLNTLNKKCEEIYEL